MPFAALRAAIADSALAQARGARSARQPQARGRRRRKAARSGERDSRSRSSSPRSLQTRTPRWTRSPPRRRASRRRVSRRPRRRTRRSPRDDRQLIMARAGGGAGAPPSGKPRGRDARAGAGEGASDRWGEDDEIVFCDGYDVQVHLRLLRAEARPEGQVAVPGVRADERGPRRPCAGEELGRAPSCPRPAGRGSRGRWTLRHTGGRGVGKTPGHARARLVCASCLPEVFVWKDVPGRGRQPAPAVIDPHGLREGAARQLAVLSLASPRAGAPRARGAR